LIEVSDTFRHILQSDAASGGLVLFVRAQSGSSIVPNDGTVLGLREMTQLSA
jgi:hypothetical protein